MVEGAWLVGLLGGTNVIGDAAYVPEPCLKLFPPLCGCGTP